MPIKKPSQKSIAYCGLCCEDCFAHQGQIADLARDLRKKLREAKFERYAKELSKLSFFKEYKDYAKCYSVLGAMVKFRCKKYCQDNGGNPWCKIKKCCQRKKLVGCWKCESLEKCDKLKTLDPTHLDAHRKNLRKLKTEGTEKFLKAKRDW